MGGRVDDTGIVKDGKHSAGVKRQYSGTLGKVGNCQITVSVHAAGASGTAPLGRRLYLPEEECDDCERRRRTAANQRPKQSTTSSWRWCNSMRSRRRCSTRGLGNRRLVARGREDDRQSAGSLKRREVVGHRRIRIQVLAGEMLVEDLTQFVCECSDLACLTQLRVTAGEYAEVRKDPTLFLAAHGHADLAFETVIARNDRFEVVQKTGVAGATAANLAY